MFGDTFRTCPVGKIPGWLLWIIKLVTPQQQQKTEI